MCERPSKLLHSYLRENNSKQLQLKISSIFMTKLPRSRQEVHDILKGMDVKTQSTTFYVDGTFLHRAWFYYQLFTIIHVIKNNLYVRLVFTLLKDKKQESYVDIFRIIDNYCLTYSNVFNVKSIYVDFEIAIHNTAINDVCSLTKFDLSSVYVQNTEIDQYLTYLFGLPFLVPQLVGDCFSDELAEILAMNEKLTKFNDYLVENYIANDSTFSPQILAEKIPIQFDTKIIIRSSNTGKITGKKLEMKMKDEHFRKLNCSKYDTGRKLEASLKKNISRRYLKSSSDVD
ncbi:hypothetical protein AGLY_000916, partial [Aphis glycines]